MLTRPFGSTVLRNISTTAAALFLASSSVPVSQQDPYAEPVQSVLMISPSDRNKYDIRTRITEIHNWQALAHAFHRAGARVLHYKGSDIPGGHREVYTRDKAIIIGRYAYMSDPEIVAQRIQNDPPVAGSLYPPRRTGDDYLAEMAFVRRVLRSQNIEPVIVKGTFIEGGNVITHSSRTVIFGLRFESERIYAQRLIDTINQTQPDHWNIVVAPLINPGDPDKGYAYYHLDTFLGREMGGGHSLFFKAATTPEAAEQIINVFGEDKIIPLNEEEGRAYAANYSPIGQSVVMPIESGRLRRILSGRGYNIISPADYGLSSFIDSGLGGPSCKAVNFLSVSSV